MAQVNLGRVGFIFKGAFTLGSAYKKNDIVTSNNIVYCAAANSTNIDVSNVAYWSVWLDFSSSASANIVHTTGDESIAGIKTFVKEIVGSINGNAGTATTLKNARTISGVSFNGSQNIEIETRLGTAIASATTTTIGTSSSGDTRHITGTTTITSLGVSITGVTKRLVFDGALTLTHNATSLILPTGANIVTVAGDTAEFVCENGASGYWRCVDYCRKAGTPLVVANDSHSHTSSTISISTSQVLTALASATAGAVGTYAFLAQSTLGTTTIVAGTTYAGSSLRFSGFRSNNNNGDAAAYCDSLNGAIQSGTWLAMGTDTWTTNSGQRATLFLRVA